MSQRYTLREEPDGSYTIIDRFTGDAASYAGRGLQKIPADMARRGLALMLDLEKAELSENERHTLSASLRG